MRHLGMTLLGLTLILGCDPSQTGPDLAKRGGGGHVASASLHGTVNGFTPYPDSTMVPLQGATVAVYFIRELPPDTTDTINGPPPPQVPGDSMLTLRLASWGRAGVATPADTLVPPPDSTTPPPPCDPSGTPSAVATTDAAGQFRIDGFLPGFYDLRVTPPVGSGFQEVLGCGFVLTDGQSRSWDFYLPPGP